MFVFRVKKTSYALLPPDRNVWLYYRYNVKHHFHASSVGRLVFTCTPNDVINDLLQTLLISEINAVCDET